MCVCVHTDTVNEKATILSLDFENKKFTGEKYFCFHIETPQKY